MKKKLTIEEAIAEVEDRLRLQETDPYGNWTFDADDGSLDAIRLVIEAARAIFGQGIIRLCRNSDCNCEVPGKVCIKCGWDV